MILHYVISVQPGSENNKPNHIICLFKQPTNTIIFSDLKQSYKFELIITVSQAFKKY